MNDDEYVERIIAGLRSEGIDLDDAARQIKAFKPPLDPLADLPQAESDRVG